MPVNTVFGKEVPLAKLEEILEAYSHSVFRPHFVNARYQRTLPPPPPERFIPQTQGNYRFTVYLEGVSTLYLGDRGTLVEKKLHPHDILVMEPYCFNAMDLSSQTKSFFSVLQKNHIDIAWMESTPDGNRIHRFRMPYSDPGLPLLYRAFCSMRHSPGEEAQSRVFIALLSLLRIAAREASPIPSRSRNIYQRMIEYVEEHYEFELTREDLARKFALSPGYISTVFKRHSGHSFKEALVELRLEKAQQMLLNTDYTLDYIAAQCGFHYVSYFIEVFRKYHTLSPGEFRANAAGKDAPAAE